MNGRRILRIFSNIAPDGSQRDWLVGENFEALAMRFLPKLGRPPGESAILALLGLTKGRRSRYDEMMMSLHDTMKLDSAYQKTCPREAISFPPGVTWMTYTDQLPHAALAGRFALEQTFHLPVASMLHPERTPLRVLERLVGHKLARA